MPSPSIVRLAEILYHAEGFSDSLDSISEPPVWVEKYLQEPHSGDCAKSPWSCLRCHAEEFVGIANYIAARWPPPTP